MAEPTFRKGSLAALFVELAQPDEDGFSRRVPVEEFTGPYGRLRMGKNGCSWCRTNGSLGRAYNIIRHQEGPGNAITSIELQGYRKLPAKKPIPKRIRNTISTMRCAVLNTSKPQCDHKDGRLDDPRLNDASRVTLDDFQPLSTAANTAKRQHCKECRETDRRFDAKTLGFAVSQFKGDGVYRGTCVGCYWHDVRRFHTEVSK